MLVAGTATHRGTIEPHARTVREFTDRIWPAFARLLADPGWSEALLVLHGGTNRAILSYCLAGGRDGKCDTFLPGLHQTPACINLIDVGEADAAGARGC